MISVIIAAAGLGKRMGGSVKKQYRMIENLPVLVKTVKAFSVLGKDTEFIIAGPQEDIEYIKSLVPDASVVAGGDIRQQSVLNALSAAHGEYILVHDAARCFVNADVIKRVTEKLKSGSDAVIPCVQPKSTIRTAEKTLNRNELFEVQTPQGFTAEALRRAFDSAAADGFIGTDEGSLCDHAGIAVDIVEGDYCNIKLTTEEDMPVNFRIGHGYDVHKMVEGRPLMLGCINIPYEKGLLGHSDADVVSHAIADAILGACALRDIGFYFPDNAKDTEGMAGSEILKRVLNLASDAGFSIVNIDATIVAQKPRLSEYIDDMKNAIAAALGISFDAVGLKATTEEGLGITGTGDAICAYAVASVKQN